MKERPILFNAEMVREILAGRKTQARRIIKPQPKLICEDKNDGQYTDDSWQMFSWKGKFYAPNVFLEIIKKKYGDIGDQLWVRETFCIVNDDDGEIWVDYRATPKYSASYPSGWENEPDSPYALRWKPPISMPYWASRIQLEITNVWVEQIQDISKKDVDAEGLIFESRPAMGLPNQVLYNGELYLSWHHAFASGWDRINGKGAWRRNDWVWVIEFRMV